MQKKTKLPETAKMYAQKAYELFDTVAKQGYKLWEETQYEETLSEEKFNGYSIIVCGERCGGFPDYVSVHIAETENTVFLEDVVETHYTSDSSLEEMIKAVETVLKDLEYLVDIYLPSKETKPSKKIPKYRKGGQIISVGELVKQEFVYFGDKLTHKGWFMSWQFRFLLNMIYSGRLFYAVKQRPDKIVCNNCGTRFADESELEKFVESQKDADDVYVVNYSPRLELGEKDIVFKGCPKCRTDAFLSELDERE